MAITPMMQQYLQIKEENPDTLLLDAGDFSMGTLVQVMYEEEASEIRMLGELGMDAITLGNHEFDYKAEGLANGCKWRPFTSHGSVQHGLGCYERSGTDKRSRTFGRCV